MKQDRMNDILAQARQELQAERQRIAQADEQHKFRLAVEAEKERIKRKKSLWQRLTEWLQFLKRIIK